MTGDERPPHSPDAEQAALGCALLDDEAARTVAELPPEAFFTVPCRAIHAAVRRLVRSGRAVDLLTVREALRDGRGLDFVDDAFLAGLPDKTPSAANLAEYLRVLEQHRQHRALIATAAEATAAARDNPAGIAGILAHAAEALAHLASGNGADAPPARTAADILKLTLPDNDNLLADRLMARGQSFVVCGAGSLGKSRMVLQLAAASIAARDWCGLETHNGQGARWLFLQTENSARRLQADFGALETWLGRDWPAVAQGLLVPDLQAEFNGLVSVANPETEQKLARLVRAAAPAVVVFDPLKDFAAGDLNSDQDMAATCAALTRIARSGHQERAVAVVHHALTGRAAAGRAVGWDRASYGRNSKVLHSWARGQLNVAAGNEQLTEFVLSCGKCSNGKEFPPFAVRLTDGLIYEADPAFDLKDWQSEMTGKGDQTPVMTVDRVRELCRQPIGKAELAKAIMADCGCCRGSAYRFIARAEKARKIRWSKEHEQYTAH